MDLVRALESFIAVAQSSSFSEAARHLRLTPSAVSKQIGALEADLGVSLVSRTTRGFSLTPFGREYLERAGRIMTEIAGAHDAVRGHAGEPRGVLRISAPATLGRLHVAPAIPHFMHLYPDLRVELRLYDRQADPIAAGVDLSIRAGHLRDSTLIAVKLAPTRRVLCATPEYVSRHGHPRVPIDLRRHNCLLSTLYTVSNTWYFTKVGETFAVTVNGTFSTNNSEGLREVVLGGIGLGLLGSWSIAPYPSNPAARRPYDRLAWGAHPGCPQYLRCLSARHARRASRARVRRVLAALHRLAALLGPWWDAEHRGFCKASPARLSHKNRCGAHRPSHGDIAAGSLEYSPSSFPGTPSDVAYERSAAPQPRG